MVKEIRPRSFDRGHATHRPEYSGAITSVVPPVPLPDQDAAGPTRRIATDRFGMHHLVDDGQLRALCGELVVDRFRLGVDVWRELKPRCAECGENVR